MAERALLAFFLGAGSISVVILALYWEHRFITSVIQALTPLVLRIHGATAIILFAALIGVLALIFFAMLMSNNIVALACIIPLAILIWNLSRSNKLD